MGVMQGVHRERMRVAVEEMLNKPLGCRWENNNNEEKEEKEITDNSFDVLECFEDRGVSDFSGVDDDDEAEFLEVYFKTPKSENTQVMYSHEEKEDVAEAPLKDRAVISVTHP